MEFIIFDEVNGNVFNEEFSDLDAARERAEYLWRGLSDYDKRRRAAFYVLQSVNPDPDAPDHFDGNPVFRLK